MRKVTALAVLMTTALSGAVPADVSEQIWSLPGQQAPAPTYPPVPAQPPAGTLMQNLQQAQPGTGWQPQQWPTPQPWGQPWGGQYQPHYAPGGQFPAYPQPQAPAYPQPQAPASPQAAPVTAASPRDDELDRLRKQVIEQEDELNRANEILANQYAELNEAYDRIEQMRAGEIEAKEARARLEQMHVTEAELQEARGRIEQLHRELDAKSASAREQVEKIDYLTRMQNEVRMQVADMVDSQRAADTMIRQQQQLISNYESQSRQVMEERDRLRNELIRLSEKVSALQADVLRALSGTLGNMPGTP